MNVQKFSDGYWKQIYRTVGTAKLFVGTLLLLAILLSACAPSGPARGVDACGPWQPIFITDADQISRELGEQILAHNLVGARLCGWRGNPTP